MYCPDSPVESGDVGMEGGWGWGWGWMGAHAMSNTAVPVPWTVHTTVTPSATTGQALALVGVNICVNKTCILGGDLFRQLYELSTETDIAYQTCYPTFSQHIDTGPTSNICVNKTSFLISFQVAKCPCNVHMYLGRGSLQTTVWAAHRDRPCLSNLLSHHFTAYWHWANQSKPWPFNTRLGGLAFWVAQLFRLKYPSSCPRYECTGHTHGAAPLILCFRGSCLTTMPPGSPGQDYTIIPVCLLYCPTKFVVVAENSDNIPTLAQGTWISNTSTAVITVMR